MLGGLDAAMRAVVYVFGFIMGASVFSFLEVLIIRIPQGRSFISGHSVCDSCGHELSALDMIPVIGWLLLGGKCRYCKAKFPPTSSIKEAFGGLCAVLILWRFDISVTGLCLFAAICLFNVSAFIDAQMKRVPTGFAVAWIVICGAGITADAVAGTDVKHVIASSLLLGAGFCISMIRKNVFPEATALFAGALFGLIPAVIASLAALISWAAARFVFRSAARFTLFLCASGALTVFFLPEINSLAGVIL